MRTLNRSHFARTVLLSAAAPAEGKNIGLIRKRLTQSHDMLNVGRLKPIYQSPESPSGKLILLREGIRAEDQSTWTPALTEIVTENLASIRPFTLRMTYDDWSMNDILHAVIPEDLHEEIPAGFAQVGHVAHVNIREQYLPYRHLIGQILLDKNTNLKTVINKLEDVGTESIFRTFPYEVLAGPDDLNVVVSHNDCTFRFNFGKVYWNTRLNTEHTRIMDKFKEGDAVCDVMAGVGPFAVPSGKRRVFVWANDLNPDSYRAMQDAVTLNRVDKFVQPFCLDGREFIRKSAKDLLRLQRTATITAKTPSRSEVKKPNPKAQTKVLQEPATFDHYVMNLPASAVEFLDAFKGLYTGHEHLFAPERGRKLPMVHVYLFSVNELDPVKESQACCDIVSRHLGHNIRPKTSEVEVFDVRLVSPKKKMFCVSFRLPPDVAFSK
ncbi:putative trna methyltransferase trm5 [Phaeomoniella chlamydospora]|uniref:tRNA (guanine(37)-N1)-methyltransferase n=1 Tax=Phaeomoniella chlamydospora TaxID=158046 RepID=A0A0G2DTW6_PHACM|nr:putative trna methyltransferase trm5 [Phaeomoniella chlamydospora]